MPGADQGWAQASMTIPTAAARSLGHTLVFALGIALLFVAPISAEGDEGKGTSSGGPPSAEELIAGSIAHHDPEGHFLSRGHRLEFRETRTGGRPDRKTVIEIDVPANFFRLARLDESEIHGVIDGEPDESTACGMTLDGQPAAEVDAETRESKRLDCAGLVRMRDYYTYLWGLPMKLRDPGSRWDEVTAAELNGRPVWRLKVTYDPEVGTDVWYFDFDPRSHALVGYRFYRDATEAKGEIISLQGVYEGHGLRLPKERAWVEVPGNRYLGTDILVGLESLSR